MSAKLIFHFDGNLSLIVGEITKRFTTVSSVVNYCRETGTEVLISNIITENSPTNERPR